MRKLLMVLMLMVAVSASAATKTAVIVNGTVDESDISIIEAGVVSVLNENKKLDILERSDEFMDMLTKEQAYQLSGEVAPKEICKFAARWGAKYVVGIYVTENRGNTVAKATIMNVATGEKLASLSNHKVIKTFEDLTVFAHTLGVNISREVSKVL